MTERVTMRATVIICGVSGIYDRYKNETGGKSAARLLQIRMPAKRKKPDELRTNELPELVLLRIVRAAMTPSRGVRRRVGSRKKK